MRSVNERPNTNDPAQPQIDSLLLNAREAQALVRLVEAGQSVARRAQFFVWMRSHVHALLPHVVSVCGAYSRHRRELQFKVFNSVVLPAHLVDALGADGSPFMERAAQHWGDAGGQAFGATLTDISSPWSGLHVAEQLDALGLRHALVHGVSRPDRPHELETLFLFLNDSACASTQKIELVVPQLHATYMRAVTTEHAVAPMSATRAASPQPTRGPPPVTERELHILHWVREGKSNQEIAQLLDISMLTVKNHIHKILGKLGANNRAHAVTLVVRLGLLPGSSQRDSAGG